MKKVWNDATLVELDITATAGGDIEDHIDDIEAWQVDGKWYHRTGHDENVSKADVERR